MEEIRSQLWVKRVENAFLELNAKPLIERIQTAEAAMMGGFSIYETTATITKNGGEWPTRSEL